MVNSSLRILIILTIVFVINQLIEFLGINIVFFNSYLDDLLCFPIILSVILFIHRKWRLKNKYFVLPISHIIISVLIFVVIFELLLPMISLKFTADIFDIVAYIAGSIFFFKFINVKPKEV